jgi:hypothetical protein
VEIVAPAAAFRPGVPAEVRLRLAAREVAHS